MNQIKYDLPVFYSTRNCPFCIRARLALAVSGVVCELREIDLKNKPQALLDASPKGTVPVLVLPDGQVIEQSMDIVYWALRQSDPLGWMQFTISEETANALMETNDTEFVPALVRLKYPERFTDLQDRDWKTLAKNFLKMLAEKLEQRRYLGGDRITLVDIAIVPFVLQYAEREPARMEKEKYRKVAAWVDGFKHSDLYRLVMADYPVWEPGSEAQHFPS